MSCKKGGFLKIRHNDLRDITARIVSEICKDTEIEPKLLPLSGEKLMKEQQIDQMKQVLTLEHGNFGKEVHRHFSI